ncbi:hypothetical protein cypCar_00013443 [Cyprinus carpio]|nr:hypothetical protein cypCar_00013443 [Cyprinus carpio]
MRIGQTKSFLLPEQHWIHLLIFVITLITGALTDEDVIKALLGGSASFKFKVTTGMKVTLAVWKKCPDQKVFVFSPIHGLKIFDNNYADRLSIKSNHSILLDKLQESDFVTYCYELTTFPNGSLQGQNKLEKTTENGDVPIMIISVGCSIGLIVLCGIIAGVVCYKKRKSNTVLNPGGPPGSQPSVRLKNKKRPKRIRSQNEEEVEIEDFNYLNMN